MQGQSEDPSLVQLELGLVDIFISLCRFEWQSGYQELATGLLQAEIEYSLFCPPLLLSSQSKRRLFEHFWSTGGARVGEDGAVGWSTWLSKEEQNKLNTSTEEFLQEKEVGGWTGWSDPPSEKIASGEVPEKSEEPVACNETTDENLDNEDIPLNDDIESLLKKLGVNVDAEPHTDVKDAKTWNRWAEEELSRDSEQWMPVHEHSGTSTFFFFFMDVNHPFALLLIFILLYFSKIGLCKCSLSPNNIMFAILKETLEIWHPLILKITRISKATSNFRGSSCLKM